jgi:hypothetical protein
MNRQKLIRVAALASVAVAVTSIATAQQSARRPSPSATKSAPMPAARRDTARTDDVREELPVVMREVFTYDGEGRRDPFYPLILTTELRPLVSDLVLTSVIFDATGRRSIAVMRDRTGGMQYRVTTGMLLGRMRVSEIRPKAVYFTIQEFGSDRRDSLLLVDTTKVRSR